LETVRHICLSSSTYPRISVLVTVDFKMNFTAYIIPIIKDKGNITIYL